MLRSQIESFGWGSNGKKFSVVAKSWSGIIVNIMLAGAARDPDQTFREHVRSVVLVHPSYTADIPAHRQGIITHLN